MVRFDELTYSYYGKSGGLKSINITIDKGSFVFICGSASEYKTTFLNLIYGEILPTSGHLHILDYVLPNDKNKLYEIREKIGYAFHPFKFFEELTVRENLLIPLLIRGKRDKNEMNRLVDVYLHELTDLNPLSLVKTLSSSEKQKLNLLRALVIDPLILLVDEPFKYLHKDDMDKWIKVFQTKSNSGMTIIATSSSQSVLEKYGVKFYILKNGKLHIENEK
jgi:ABC-type ATPase involved in cell division